MQIKKFEAKTMTEALRKVKQEFGSEAVILSARSVKKESGVFRLRSPKVEVTAAKDSLVGQHRETHMATGTYNQTGTVYAHSPRPATRQPEPSDHVQIRTRRIPIKRPAVTGGQHASLNRSRTRQPTWEAPREKASEKNAFTRSLVQKGVDEALATQVWLSGTTGDHTHGLESGEKHPVDRLMRYLAERGLIGQEILLNENRQKIVALMGSCGVGKTMTLAKIASRHACQEKKRVAFISLDDYRIAANAELKIYSRILDIPLAVVADQLAFEDALKRFRDFDLILIDTPGITPDQPDYLNIVSMLTSVGAAIDCYLLLSAATRDQELTRLVKRLDLLKPTGYIITKLDECYSCGHLLNLLANTDIPAVYVTNGQRVPEDIRVLSAERLAEIMLGIENPSRAKSAAHTRHHPSLPLDEDSTPVDWHYIANKKTDLYHSPLCESAKRIKTANIEHFTTRDAAERERYHPCRLCIPSRSDQGSLPAQYAV